MLKIVIGINIFIFAITFPIIGLASITNGTIDSVYKYAWSKNAGWINFGATNGNVYITDSLLTGYIWSENYGWINLSPTNSGVKNDGNGNLSGYAWGENLGWINFDGVTINSSGKFEGSATNDILGDINFNCTNCKVLTDYQPKASRPQCNNNEDDDGDGRIDYPNDMGCSSLDDNTEAGEVQGSGRNTSGSAVFYFPDPLLSILETASESLKFMLASLWEPIYKKSGLAKILIPIEEAVTREAPPALKGKWILLASANRFALAPLPAGIARLAQKFPEFGETLQKVGVTKISDLEKLRSVKLKLSGITESAGLPKSKIAYGHFSLPAGVPLSNLSASMKNKIPSEIVFAKTGGELIDFDITLTINAKGETEQKIQTVVGKPVKLVVKPDKPVKTVKGYVVFKSRKSQKTSFDYNPVLNDMTASALFSNPKFSYVQEKPVEESEELVLLEFEYVDPDGDGIYTAEINAPLVDGEYEIITVMNYEDPRLALREMRLITVVDPEGYIYEKNGDKETRLPGAIVTLSWLNPETKQYEIWPAQEYQQENPQVTDIRGTYSFLVPEGFYNLSVETPGYSNYEGRPFQVAEGSGVHVNIEMKTKYWWLNMLDWKTILLIVVMLLLVYNFYKDKIRDQSLVK